MSYPLTLPPAVAAVLPYVAGALAAAAAWRWLRRDLTPRWLLSLVESEGVPSIRLLLAGAVVLFSLFMQAAGRLPLGVLEANYTFAAVLLGLGVTKVVAKAYANRPPEAPTQINAD